MGYRMLERLVPKKPGVPTDAYLLATVTVAELQQAELGFYDGAEDYPGDTSGWLFMSSLELEMRTEAYRLARLGPAYRL